MHGADQQPSPWGVEPSYVDAFGQLKTIRPQSIEKIATALATDAQAEKCRRDVLVFQGGECRRLQVPHCAGPVTWRLDSADGTIALGTSENSKIEFPAELEMGSYWLRGSSSDGTPFDFLVLMAPEMAYQPEIFRAGKSAWLLSVQLYAVHSEGNWGHGDFSDLAKLLRLARDYGAAGVGVNPLHTLFPGQASPYSPSSRLFLNPLYIDVAAIPEFPGIAACGLSQQIDALRARDTVDYATVHALKYEALRRTFAIFQERATPDRRERFAAFRQQAGESLKRFAAFETLRERFGAPWQDWPPQWRQAASALPRLAAESSSGTEFHAFVQWIAHEQLHACSEVARELALPIGLYLDVAVGCDIGGADAWANSEALAQDLSIGAPPDLYNPAGQNWGIAAFHPQALIDTDFALFRETLRSAMKYAGAIRLDHALGLNRLFLIPAHAGAAEGAYVRFPFQAMLGATAQESVRHRCMVIGEDLGTIPEGVFEALHGWGIWSYRVGMFEREPHGLFRSPDGYTQRALVTFATHDLPTFAGWVSSHDLKVKQDIGVDAGESASERERAINDMIRTLAHYDIDSSVSFLGVLNYLARSRSQLLAISIEDILGILDQTNIPGTVSEHANWQRRLPLGIEEFASHESFRRVDHLLRAAQRACVS